MIPCTRYFYDTPTYSFKYMCRPIIILLFYYFPIYKNFNTLIDRKSVGNIFVINQPKETLSGSSLLFIPFSFCSRFPLSINQVPTLYQSFDDWNQEQFNPFYLLLSVYDEVPKIQQTDKTIFPSSSVKALHVQQMHFSRRHNLLF